MTSEIQQLQEQIVQLEKRVQTIEARLVEAPPPTLVEVQALVQTLAKQLEEFKISIREEMRLQRQWITEEMNTFREWLKALDSHIQRLEARMDQQVERLEARMDQQVERLEARMDNIEARIDNLETLVEQRFKWIVGFLITTLVSLFGLGFLNILLFIIRANQ